MLLLVGQKRWKNQQSFLYFNILEDGLVNIAGNQAEPVEGAHSCIIYKTQGRQEWVVAAVLLILPLGEMYRKKEGCAAVHAHIERDSLDETLLTSALFSYLRTTRYMYILVHSVDKSLLGFDLCRFSRYCWTRVVSPASCWEETKDSVK